MHCSSGLHFKSSGFQGFLLIVSLMSMKILSQVRASVEALEWKIRLFLSFQICQRVKPGRSCQMYARIRFLWESESQFSIVSPMLLLFWFDLRIAWDPWSHIHWLKWHLLKRCSIVSSCCWLKVQIEGPMKPFFLGLSQVRTRLWAISHKKVGTLGQSVGLQTLFQMYRIEYGLYMMRLRLVVIKKYNFIGGSYGNDHWIELSLDDCEECYPPHLGSIPIMKWIKLIMSVIMALITFHGMWSYKNP